MTKKLFLVFAALQFVAACTMTSSGVWPQSTLARAQATPDLASYHVQRVAVVPFTGTELTPQRALELGNSLALELAPRTTFELVQLSVEDLAEIPRAEPWRRGWYAAGTLLAVAERFHVDAILVGTVREWNVYTPQRMAAQIELVSCDTGMVAWSSAVELDARDERVRKAIEAWYAIELDSHDAPGDEALAFLSPQQFARFAMRELARSY